MNNLIENYKIILNHLKATCQDIESFHQIRKPKLGNLELVALNLTAEYMSINTELQLFRYLKGTCLEPMIERSVYNKRRKKLFNYTEAIRKRISEMFAHFTDVFVLDSMPSPICKYARAGRSNICATYEIQPSFGYNASQKCKYFGYKLHAVCDKNGVFHSFDLTPAHIHDVNYLKDVKYNLSNCTLIGDRGYISTEYQTDLFTQSNINLSVPMRKNQHGFVQFSKTKAIIRKRIETNFSQLHGQFLWTVNHAKSFIGLATRLLSKITAFTMIQYLNVFVFNRPMNKIKVNLT
ncbi:MAG: IS982 family transposase [Gammaproteobacteria bacterium]|nr:IS982 family transposase [Gammaproteobacteria bacterium]